MQLLVHDLKLPYTSVQKLPEWFDIIPIGLWALPKLYTYNIQREPFFHIDNDIFIWQSFPEKLEKSGLVVQNYENLTSGYHLGLDYIEKKLLRFLPAFRSKTEILLDRSMLVFSVEVTSIL